MDEIKKLSPQMRYYYKNKDEINKKQIDKYINDPIFKKYIDDKKKVSYEKNKQNYHEYNIKWHTEKYKTDTSYREKRLEYARKYREMKKNEKNEKNEVN